MMGRPPHGQRVRPSGLGRTLLRCVHVAWLSLHSNAVVLEGARFFSNSAPADGGDDFTDGARSCPLFLQRCRLLSQEQVRLCTTVIVLRVASCCEPCEHIYSRHIR